MKQKIDQSKRISQLIKFLSNALAQQRGLVPVVGIVLVLVGLIVMLINVFLDNNVLEFLGLSVQGVGIIAALIGMLLSEPLGK